MNKAELIEAIADHADLTKADAGRALDAVIMLARCHYSSPNRGGIKNSAHFLSTC